MTNTSESAGCGFGFVEIIQKVCGFSTKKYQGKLWIPEIKSQVKAVDFSF